MELKKKATDHSFFFFAFCQSCIYLHQLHPLWICWSLDTLQLPREMFISLKCLSLFPKLQSFITVCYSSFLELVLMRILQKKLIQIITNVLFSFQVREDSELSYTLSLQGSIHVSRWHLLALNSEKGIAVDEYN